MSSKLQVDLRTNDGPLLEEFQHRGAVPAPAERRLGVDSEGGTREVVELRQPERPGADHGAVDGLAEGDEPAPAAGVAQAGRHLGQRPGVGERTVVALRPLVDGVPGRDLAVVERVDLTDFHVRRR